MPAPAAAPAIEAPALITIAIPRIGAYWPEQGGHFAGIVGGENGAPDHLLIIGPEAPKKKIWQQALDWAAQLATDGHSDYALPTPQEQAIAYGNTKSLFESDWYWSGTQSAGDERCAWVQFFYDGLQGFNPKGITLRARAVRRLNLSIQ